jgi:hypothetical protein
MKSVATVKKESTMATPTHPMAPPPTSSSRWGKENSTTVNNQSLDWRNESDTTKTTKTLSKGLSARSFHSDSRRRPRPGQQAVQDLHSEVQTSLLKQEKKKVGQRNELQRSAFKQVTALRTWPLQERAMRHWNDLMKEHLHLSPDDEQQEEIDSKSQQIASSQTPSVGDSSSLSSSSSSSSGLSAPEPKRVLRDCLASPAQSRLKVQYRQAFLAEQAIERPVSLADSSQVFGSSPLLWCMEPRVFSVEKSGQGKRKYVVGHLGRFLDIYWRKSDRLHRNYYELIKERTPCRLYFDLEFSKLTNPNITNGFAEGLLQEFYEELSVELTQRYNLSRPLLYSDIVDLDSSTPTKFSRHWIVHLADQTLFAHAIATGKFIQAFIGRLADLQATGQLVHHRPLLHKYLFVHAAPTKSNPLDDNTQDTASMGAGKTSCFVDLGVYTRNRLFRLMGSSKFGKPASAALRIADANEFPFPEGFGNECFYLPSMEEHLRKEQQDAISQGETTHGNDDDDLSEAVNKFVASTDWTLHAEALALTLVVPVNVSKIDFPILPYEEDETEETNGGNTKRKPAGVARTTTASSSVGPSPYPVLDKYVLKCLAARGGIQGSIRAWSIDADSQGTPVSIAYQMSRNRWCECIRREHKSNNIMWTIDFVNWQCVQGCHDPECRGLRFRGTPIDLPKDVREVVQDALFEEQLACLDEQALLDQRKVAPITSLRETIEEDEDEAFEKALMALNLDGEKTADQQVETPFHSEAVSGGAEEIAKAAHPSSKVAPRAGNMPDESDSDSDSDFDILAFARKLERQKNELEGSGTTDPLEAGALQSKKETHGDNSF